MNKPALVLQQNVATHLLQNLLLVGPAVEMSYNFFSHVHLKRSVPVQLHGVFLVKHCNVADSLAELTLVGIFVKWLVALYATAFGTVAL